MLELLLTTALLMGGEPPESCPHMTAEAQPAEAEPLYPRECGTGITVSSHGTTVATNYCPLLVIMRPAHARMRISPGSNTYVEPAGQFAVKRLHYACETGYVLWILPILGSSCVFKGEANAGSVTHYVQHNCPVIKTAPRSTT